MLAVACGVIFMDMIGYGVIIPILPIYAQKLGASKGQIGFLFSSYSLILILTLIPFGFIVDRYGGKKMIVLGMFLLCIASILFATSYSLLQLTISRMLQGLAASCTWAAALPLAAVVATESKRGLEMSSVTVATGLGTILGPLVGGWGTIQTPFYICMVMSFILTILACVYLKDVGKEKKYVRIKERLGRILRQKEVQTSCVAIGILYFAVGMLEVLFPLYMADHQCKRMMVGFIFTVYGIFFVVFQPAIGAWSDRQGRILPIAGGLFITALFIPVPFFFTAKGLWIFLFIILGIAGAMAFTPIYPLIADGVSPTDQGVAYSLNSWIFSIGYLLGPWIGGVLAELAGMKAPFFLCSALLLASISAIWMMSGRNESWSG